MASIVAVEWWTYSDRHGEASVSTADEAERLFWSIDDDPSTGPVLVAFSFDGRPFLTIGAGRDHSVLSYMDTLDPPYYASLGTERTIDNADFSYGGQSTEIPSRSLIDKQSAVVGLREFVETETRPTTPAWEVV